MPSATCIAIEAKRKVRLPEYPPIDLYYWKKENLEFGIVKKNISVYEVLITDMERTVCDAVAENGGYPPTQNGDIRSLFWLFSLMALQN